MAAQNEPKKSKSGGAQVKDKGTRQQYPSGMVREPEAGRPRFDLMLPKDVPYENQMIYRFAMQMGKGADKYAERQWEPANTQEELDRYLSSAFRHFMQWYFNETDEDHAAAVMFNVTAAESVRWKMKNDKKPE